MNTKKPLFIVTAVLVVIFTLTTTALALDWGPLQKVGWGGDWDMYPEVAAGTDGKMYVVWWTRPSDWSIYFNSYDGETWGTAQRIGARDWNKTPDLFVDSSGKVHVAWMGSYYMYYSRFNGTSWFGPVPVIPANGEADIVVLNDGTVMLMNNDMSKGLYVLLGDGITWSAPIPVGDYAPGDLSIDVNGVPYVAYSDYATYGKIAYRTWTGSGWSDETLLDYYCAYLKMFHGPNGTADILCLDNDIQQWHYDGSTWSEPTLVVSSAGNWRNAYGAPNGMLAVSWAVPIPENADRQDVFVRVWTGSKWLDAGNASSTEWISIFPAVGLTSDNKVIAVWSENDYHEWAFTLKSRDAWLVLNSPPDARLLVPISADEGQIIPLDASLSSDPDGSIALYGWDFDNDGAFDDASGITAQVTFLDDGVFQVGLRVTDASGELDTDFAQITVQNVPPAIESILVSPASLPVGQTINLSGTFTDPGKDTWTARWDWGDSYTTQGDIEDFSVTGSHVYNLPGIYTITLTLDDDDGGVAVVTAQATVLNIPPVVGTPIVESEPSLEGSSVIVNAAFQDTGADNEPFTCTVNYGDGSGEQVAAVDGNTCTGPGHIYQTFGLYPVVVHVTDRYGDTGSNTSTHIVLFNWAGFFRPVDNPPTLNRVYAGSAIPVKFSLSGNKGLNIFAGGSPQSKQVACDTGAAMDDIDVTVTAGGSSLSYDPVTGIYNYVWKTDKAWAGTCRQLMVLLVDGTEHLANFQFK